MYVRRKGGFKLRMIAEEALIVPIAQRVAECRALIAVNGSGRFIWEQLGDSTTNEYLAMGLVEKYDIDIARAREDVAAFLSELVSHGLVDMERD